jgi:hypothetical protein
MISIRPSSSLDADAVWKILEPTIRAGETYTLPRDFTREQALRYWYAPHHDVFVAEEDGEGKEKFSAPIIFVRINKAGAAMSPIADT